MANAIFYEGLHIAELITAVMAFAIFGRCWRKPLREPVMKFS
jgi:hypothetical protein